MKKWFKNSKGLTLVELLAVIVILGIVAAIAVPSISKSISSSKYKADFGSYDLVYDAAVRWSIEDQAEGGDGETTATGDTVATELVGKGYLAKAPNAFNTLAETIDTFIVDIGTNGQITVTLMSGTDKVRKNTTTKTMEVYT